MENKPRPDQTPNKEFAMKLFLVLGPHNIQLKPERPVNKKPGTHYQTKLAMKITITKVYLGILHPFTKVIVFSLLYKHSNNDTLIRFAGQIKIVG